VLFFMLFQEVLELQVRYMIDSKNGGRLVYSNECGLTVTGLPASTTNPIIPVGYIVNDGTTVQWTFLGQLKSWTPGTSYSINDIVIPAYSLQNWVSL